jgi:hypothetical protein
MIADHRNPGPSPHPPAPAPLPSGERSGGDEERAPYWFPITAIPPPSWPPPVGGRQTPAPSGGGVGWGGVSITAGAWRWVRSVMFPFTLIPAPLLTSPRWGEELYGDSPARGRNGQNTRTNLPYIPSERASYARRSPLARARGRGAGGEGVPSRPATPRLNNRRR